MAETSRDADRIEALELHAHTVTEALMRLVECTSALTVVNAATMDLLDPADRARIREAALAGLGDGSAAERARAIVETLTQDPLAAQVDHQAALTEATAPLPSRLQ